MRRSVNFIKYILLVIFLMTVWHIGYAQESNNEITPDNNILQIDNTTFADTIFVEILLNSYGVIAYDSLGNLWKYSFENSRFEFSPDQIADEITKDGENELEIPSVEDRCTDQIIVPDFVEDALFVGYEEYVISDVFAYGKVTVKGWVQGNIQSITGPVIISSSGQVDGDIRSPEIIIRGEGVHLGDQIISDQLEIPELLVSGFSDQWLWIVTVITVVALILSFLFASLFPKNIDNISDCLKRHPLRSFLSGLLMLFLLPIIMIILALTIVGIVLLPVLILLYFGSLVLSMIFIGTKADAFLISKFSKSNRSLIFKAIFGVLLFMTLWFAVAFTLGSGDIISQGIGTFLLVISILLNSYYFLNGVGAVLLTRFGSRVYYSYKDRLEGSNGDKLEPAPPPIPNAPPISTPIFENVENIDSDQNQ